MDKIVQTIKSIILLSEDGKLIGGNVNFDDDSNKTLVNEAEIYEALATFASQQGKLVSELLEDKDLVSIENISMDKEPVEKDDVKEEMKEEEKVKKEEVKEEKEEVKEVVKTKKERKGLKLLGRVGIITAAGVVVYVAMSAVGLLRGNKGYDLDKSSDLTRNGKDIEAEDIITKNDKLEPVVDNGSQYIPNLEDIRNENNLKEKVERIITHDPMSSREFFNIINDVNMELSANINEVCNLVDGGRMNGDEYLLYYENMFSSDSFDYDAMKRFCGLRNDIVHNAYFQNSLITKSQITNFLEEFTSFLYKGRVYSFGNNIYGFNDLQPMTRYIITVLGQKMLEANVSYETQIEGNNYNQNALRDGTADFFNDTVMTNLIESIENRK